MEDGGGGHVGGVGGVEAGGMGNGGEGGSGQWLQGFLPPQPAPQQPFQRPHPLAPFGAPGFGGQPDALTQYLMALHGARTMPMTPMRGMP